MNSSGDLLQNQPLRASTPKKDDGCLDSEVTPTPRRRQSMFNCNDFKDANMSLTYDSGNYSSSSNNSENGNDISMPENEPSFFWALQDVRKFYSEERKYMRENQRLQSECVRMYTKCGEMEQSLQVQTAKAVGDLHSTRLNEEVNETYNNEFEIEQQQALIKDQQKLIAVLRKQKNALLEDLKHLSAEKDEKLHALQITHANLELENTHVKTKCQSLVAEYHAMQEALELNAAHLALNNLEKSRLYGLISDLSAQLQSQEQLLMQKEHEILSLQVEFKSNLNSHTNVDEVHQLSSKYHAEINAKTQQIVTLKNSLLQLQEELSTLAALSTQNEKQAQQIENLTISLEKHQLEITELERNDEVKIQQISELQLREEKLCSENVACMEKLNATQTSLQKVQRELIALNESYAEMCALCERTKFELEMCELEKEKLHFQAESDSNEIVLLRNKLKDNLKDLALMRKKIELLEQNLQKLMKEKTETKANLELVENCLVEESKRLERAEDIQVANDKELKVLQVKLKSNEDEIINLKNQNSKLNDLNDQRDDYVKSTNKDLKKLQVELEANQIVLDAIKVENEYLKKLVIAIQARKKEEKQEQESRALEQTTSGYECATNAEVECEIEQVENQKLEMYAELNQMKQTADAFQANLEKAEQSLEESENAIRTDGEQDGIEELHYYRDKIQELKKQIRVWGTMEEDKITQRIQMVKEMLEPNNGQQINETTQIEFEKEFRLASNATTTIEEQKRKVLVQKRAELEELNKFFAEQHRTLRKLHKDEFPRQNETNTFQQQLKVMQEKLTLREKENAEQVKYIEELKREIGNLKLNGMKVENDARKINLSEMKEKMEVALIDEEKLKVTNIDCERLKADYERKIKRYDLHIHTLLNNMKILKRALKAADKKSDHQQDLQRMKRNLEDLRLKYAQSQRKVKTLTEERQKYEAADFEKSTHQTPASHTHEMSNLMDDYKKLIKQSALISQRQQTSAILELIQRSNQYVPNLNKIGTALIGLRSDLLQYLAKEEYDATLSTPLITATTLMDELRAANASEDF